MTSRSITCYKQLPLYFQIFRNTAIFNSPLCTYYKRIYILICNLKIVNSTDEVRIPQYESFLLTSIPSNLIIILNIFSCLPKVLMILKTFFSLKTSIKMYLYCFAISNRFSFFFLIITLFKGK